MKIKFSNGKIILEKKLNFLDRLALDFTLVLNKSKIQYVLLSGYIPILFGRNRSSEDIDIVIGKISFNRFAGLWKKLSHDFECITTSSHKDAYFNYLMTGHAIRFSMKNRFIPNMELKFPKTELDEWTLKSKKEVVLNKKTLFVSPFELQIPFKLFLGSGKDIEDAKYLYELFKDKINLRLLRQFSQKLKIAEVFNRYLK